MEYNPELIRFNKRYKALLDHYKKGYCTMEQVLEVIDILERDRDIINALEFERITDIKVTMKNIDMIIEMLINDFEENK